jgi:hypothetical protein
MTEHSKHSHNSDPGFERQDLKPWNVYVFLIGLAAAGIAVYFAIWGVYDFMGYYNRTHQPPASPMIQAPADTRAVTSAEVKQFAQPRLETNERVEIDQFRLQEEQRLNSYGWVDQPGGAVHIPIEQAMQIVARNGLNSAPKTGEVPTSTVSVINDAAQKSDTSGMNQQKAQTPQGGKAQP